MRIGSGRCRWFVAGFLALVMSGLVSDRAGAQDDLKSLAADIRKAWEAHDFTRVEAAGRRYLALVEKPESPEQMTVFMHIGGAETVAGRLEAAADHVLRIIDYVARLNCQNQAPQHQIVAALISNFIAQLPPGSRGNPQIMLNKVWESVLEKARKPDASTHTYLGFPAVIAAGLAHLSYASGADSVARTYADEAILSAPPVDVPEIPYESEAICGCIKIRPFRDFWVEDSVSRVGDYIAYIRAVTNRFTHQPRALALLAGIEIFIKTRDDARLRRAAAALEELLDRSLTTGSLNILPWLKEDIDKLYAKLKEQYPQIWPAPKTHPPISPAEADGDPRLGKTGPAFTRKSVNRYGGDSGKKYSFDHWPILVRTSIPVQPGEIPSDKPLIKPAPHGQRPLNAMPQAGAGRVAVDRPWWLYALEDGQLRVVGRALAWSAGKQPDSPWELIVETLALGDLWSVAAILQKEDTQEPLKALGPVYASQELLGPDFEDLPPHRQKMFLQGLPWIGMSSRLLRVNLQYCDRSMMNWKTYHWKFPPDLTIKGSTWTLILRGGRVVDVIGGPTGAK